MNISAILVAILTAIVFSSWPILAKYSGASIAWVTVILYMGGLIAVSSMAAKQLIAEPVCTGKAVLILLVVGLINGLAVWLYTMKSIDKGINTSLFMVTVSIISIITAPLLNQFVNGEALTNKQWAGVALAVVVIWLMKK